MGGKCSIPDMAAPAPTPPLRTIALAAWLLLGALATSSEWWSPQDAALPPIVFVARHATTQRPTDGQIPGLGPHGSTLAVGGQLMLREPNGRIRELLPRATLLDVQDPDVSWDAKRVVFSGLASREGDWRLYVLTLANGECEALGGGLEPGAGIDDFDPCWNGDQVVFVRTQPGRTSRYDESRAGVLCVWDPRTQQVELALEEANGLLDPVVDLRRGTLVFARWWFNPWLPRAAGGVTRDATLAMTRDTVNQWQVMEYSTRFGERLRVGGVMDRRAGMGVQPALLGDAVVATFAANTGLAPRPGPTGVHVMPRVGSPGRRLIGAAIGDDLASPYAEGTGLSAPSACAPAVLPDGRLIVSFAPGARNDFGLSLLTRHGRRTSLVEVPDMLELDAAPVLRRTGRPVPLLAAGSRASRSDSFRFLDLDVFAGRGAPPRQNGARLRFFAWSADSSPMSPPTLLFEAPVPRQGRVDVRVPRVGPTFEQLVGADGRVLMSAHGPAQVRGFNTPPPASDARCVGCHLGHSVER